MLENFHIEEFVPRFLIRDRDGYALAKAMEGILKLAFSWIEAGVAMIDDVDRMPEWRLDERAWELNAQWYDYSADIETKRAVIRGAQEYFNRLGTPYAVERAIRDVYGTGNVVEWFEYGGEPFTFRVYTANTAALNEKRAKFMKLLEIVKNTRSELENIYYGGENGTAAVHAATAIVGMSGYAQARAKKY